MTCNLIVGSYEGVAKKGFIANTLTPFVGDANTQTIYGTLTEKMEMTIR